MGEVKIVEVKTKSQRRKFVDLPNKMYRDVPQFVPAFYGDDMADWSKKNPARQYCEARSFLAYRDGEIVGRIGAILSHSSNEKWGFQRMRFTQVDFIDDTEVSDKLFEAVETWAKEKGCTEVHGPLGFCDLDREGMLVEGFDQRSMFITYYNHPYYIDHLTRLGYVKDTDWIECKIPVPKAGDPTYERIHNLAEQVAKRSNYHKADLRNHKEFKPYIRKVFQMINDAYADLYGTVDLVSDQIEKYADKFIPLINPEYCCLVLNDANELMGFGVCAPSMATAMQKNHGKLFPFGWIRVLRALKKNTVIDLLLIAVKPELQKTGVNAIIIDHIMQGCNQNGIAYAESGPMLETNHAVLNQWRTFGAVFDKRRRCFVKSI